MNEEKKLKRAVIRFVLALVIAVGLVVAIVIREGKVAQEIRQSQIESCEKNGNTLRVVLQNRIHNEIIQTSNRSLLEKFFPNITEDELDKFIKKSVKERRKEIKEVAPINCMKEYK